MFKTLKNMNLIFFILMIGINTLANIMPIGHGDTGAISAKYPNLFTPAPITFSIWGVIYILVAFFIFYQYELLSDHVYAKNMVMLIGPWFIISCLFNIGWIFSWHYEKIFLSVLCMAGLLFSLIMITYAISPASMADASNIESVPMAARICMYAFDLYLGWITAASIANMSVLLTKMKWNRFGLSKEFWTCTVIIVGAVLAMLFILMSEKYVSAIAIIWAYCGILIRHISQSGYSGAYPLIIIVTLVAISAIIATGIIKAIMEMSAWDFN